MKKQLFPNEIIRYSGEYHFKKHSLSVKYIYILVLILVIGLFVSLPFISLNISTQSRGIIKSTDPPVNLISSVAGIVTNSILDENMHVEKGDTLIWVELEGLDEKIALIRDIKIKNQTLIDDLGKLLHESLLGLRSDFYRQKLRYYQERIDECDLQISILKREFGRSKKLFDLDVIPSAEFEQIHFRYKNAVKERNVFIETQKNEWIYEKRQLEDSNRKLQTELAQLDEDRNLYYLISPVDGVVCEYKGVKDGSYVSINQELAIITPIDKLVVDNYVSPADISYISKGMKTKFQVDSYNYNQWGMASGVVIDIASQPVLRNEQVLFRVRCSLEQDYLQLNSGYQGMLMNGLTLTSRFEIADRTIFQLMYDKTDKWLNPKLIAGNSKTHN